MTASIATDAKSAAKLPSSRREKDNMSRPVDGDLLDRVYIGDLTFEDYLDEIRAN